MNEQELMQKLVLSKAIMDKSDKIKSPNMDSLPQNTVENFSVPSARYNIPSEFMNEQSSEPLLSSPNVKPVGVPSVEAIRNSKLPDEIKRLMIEHPINQPQQYSPSLSNDLVEKASRLMKNESRTNQPIKTKTPETQIKSSIDYKLIKQMIEEAVNDALKENGLLVESNQKTNEAFSFRVGKHIFEGKVSKIKKLS